MEYLGKVQSIESNTYLEISNTVAAAAAAAAVINASDRKGIVPAAVRMTSGSVHLERPISNETIATDTADLSSSNLNAFTSSSESTSSVGDQQQLFPVRGCLVSNPIPNNTTITSENHIAHIYSFGSSASKNISGNHSCAELTKVTQSLETTSKILTPSERYRLRRENSKKVLQSTIKQRESYYDEHDSSMITRIPRRKTISSASPCTSMVSNLSTSSSTGSCATSFKARKKSTSLTTDLETSFETDELDASLSDYLGWDVPIASATAVPFLASAVGSPKDNGSPSGSGFHKQLPIRPHLRKADSGLLLDHSKLPPSPIPGIQNMSDSQFFQQTSKTLTSVYLDSSVEFSKSKLWERTQSAELLPMEFQSASNEGMEDLKLVSSDKMAMCSPSRPTWLPPKDSSEKVKHEKQIEMTINNASFVQLSKQKEREERELRDEKNRNKLILLIDRGLNRKSSLCEFKKICWDTSLQNDYRNFIYRTILQSDGAKIIEEQFIDGILHSDRILKSMKFPHDKLLEIKTLLDQLPFVIEEKYEKKLIYLLQLKSISTQGLVVGDEILFYHFLKTETLEINEIWVLVNLLQLTCFNEVTKEKYDQRILNPKGVVAGYLKNDKSFESEFNPKCLNFITWWYIMARLDHSIFMWCLDIIVAENSQPLKSGSIPKDNYCSSDWDKYRERHVFVNYKILASLTLNVLLNYHFGYNNLYELSVLDKKFKIIEGRSSIDEVSASAKPNSATIITTYDNIDEVHLTFMKKWHHYYKKF